MRHYLHGNKAARRSSGDERRNILNQTYIMLAIIGIILIVCWLLGLTLHIAGGFIHLILVIALVMVVLFLMLQKEFVAGLTTGAVKG